MAADNKIKMSQEHYDELQAQLHYLETDRAKEVAELIKEARSFGDLSENSEYDEAKSEQGKLYSKIAEIKNQIDNAEIVDMQENSGDSGTVSLGSVVKVRNMNSGRELEYTIVGSQEANPMKGLVSEDSPFGRGLYGHAAGENVKIEAPAGELYFEIISVEN